MKYSSTLTYCLGILGFLLCTTVLSSQCTTGCNIQCINQLNLSLNESCEAEFTADMGAIGVTFGDPCYAVTLEDEHGQLVPGNLVDMNHIDQNLTYTVTELECGNPCWGKVRVEYKLAPQIECPADMTIACGALDFLELPPATGGCAAFNVQLYSQEKVHLDCDTLHQAYVDRTYVASDNQGNSSSCTHRVFLERVQLSDIVFPENATISCSDTTMRFDAEGFPLPWYFQSVTGSGTASGVPLICDVGFPTPFSCGAMTGSGSGALPLIPSGGGVIIVETGDADNPIEIEVIPESNTELLCNAVLLYSDLEFPVANGCKRKIARTWEVFEWWCHEELSVSGVQFIEIIDDKAPIFECPVAQLVSTTDDCAAEILLPAINPVDICGDSVNVRINYEGGVINSDGGFASLKTGPNVITYTASDNCNNSSSCTTVFTVKDLTAPIAICARDKVVALSTSMTSRVPAEVFDNGSFDDCHLDKFEVRRMENTCTEQDTAWSHYVDFCCVDAQQENVMVALRVSDAYGNASQCMIRVEVQDKSIPSLTCPDDITIDCSEPYDLNNLGQSFGSPVVVGNCASGQLPHTEVDSDMSQCGVGQMTRTFSIQDANGNVLRSCKQSVTVTNNTPFTFEQIVWPLDYEVDEGCDASNLHPELLPSPHNFPTFDVQDGQCSMLGYDFTDKVFSADPGTGGCSVIQRSWTVVDWCSSTEGNVVIWRSPQPQLIKVNNNNAPILDDSSDLTIETSNGDCNSGTVSIVRNAIDDCTTNLRWQYTLKTASGDIIQMDDTNAINGSFPTGNYVIEWTVFDGCGNSDQDTQVLNVISTKSPTPICHSGLSASLVSMDLDGDGVIDAEMVELWASDFDAGSYPACNNPIVVSFSADTTDRVKVFDCSDLGRQNIQMWVTDLVTGVQDFCVGFIEIQDAGICPDGQRVAVGGVVTTEMEAEIEGVEMALVGTSDMRLTNDDGSYAFADMPMGGSYVVSPSFDVNYLNGVSTIDLIKIQRHVLGIELLNSPYKLIAADVNNSGSINGIDLVELRKLILGIYTELPNNDSWRFISTEYNFSNPINPWAESWMEEYEITSLDNDMALDFIGVKIGDVDDSALTNVGENTTASSANDRVELDVNHGSISTGEESKVTITAADYADIIGWQGTLEFDSEKFEIIDVETNLIDFDFETNFNTSTQSEGYVTMSYNSRSTAKPQELKLELTIRALADIASDEELFLLTSKVAKAEVYNNALEKLDLVINSGTAENRSEILSTYPNPWITNANIQLRMAQSDNCLLEFFNVNGQLIYNMEQHLTEGVHEITVTKEQLETNGLIYLRMTVDGESSDYRMMVY